MRKPYFFVTGAVAVLLALAAFQFARPSKAVSPRLERYLPAETVGFVQVNDLRAQALRVIESEAWREFTRENEAASSLFMITANHAGALDASYALGLVGAGEGPEGRRRPQFVAVAEFDGAGARRVFENRVLKLAREAEGEGVKTATEDYAGSTINVVSREGREGIAYSQAENTLYLSNAAAAIRQALDVRAGRLPSLEANETFSQARARAGYGDGMFGFLDGAALARLIDSAPGDKGVAAFRQLFHAAGADSVRSVAFTSTFEDGRVAERFVVTAPHKTGVLETLSSNPPTPQALLAYVPADALQVFDASVANAPQAFDQLVALAAQLHERGGKKGPAEGLAEFTAKTGVDLRGELVGALGNEICFAQLPGADGRSGVVILNVRSAEGFEQALRKLFAGKGGSVTEREHLGARVARVTGEKGRGFEFAFVGDNFVMSGEARGVERVIETARGGASIKSSPAYQSASAAGQGAQFVYFNTNADYLNRLGGMLKSGEQEFKTEGQSASIRPSFAYGLSRPDGFYVESRTPLGTFPRLLTAVTAKIGDTHEGGEGSKQAE